MNDKIRARSIKLSFQHTQKNGYRSCEVNLCKHKWKTNEELSPSSTGDPYDAQILRTSGRTTTTDEKASEF